MCDRDRSPRSLSLRPGHDLWEIESAFSIGELQQGVRARARTVRTGEWITAVGGWAPNQFTERRMPTQAELDAAAPDHPVYLQTGFVGPSVTNTKGRAFFEQRGIAVGADGSIGMNAPSAAAWNALKSWPRSTICAGVSRTCRESTSRRSIG